MERSPSLLCVGLACVDIVNTVAACPAEDTCCRTLSQRVARGGNASTSAVVAAQCGIRTTWLGTLPSAGSADSALILGDLAAHGVGAAAAHRGAVARAPTSYVTLSASTGTRTIAHHRGDLDELGIGDLPDWGGAAYDWVHLEGRAGARGAIEAAARALRPSATVASLELEKVDAGLDDVAPLVDVVFYSREVAEHAGFDDPVAFLKDRAAALGDGPRVLTCAWGAAGAAAAEITSDGAVVLSRCAAVRVGAVVDSVGAGDTFNGAFVAARLRNATVGDALRVACVVAGAKVGRVGFSGLAYPDASALRAVLPPLPRPTPSGFSGWKLQG